MYPAILRYLATKRNLSQGLTRADFDWYFAGILEAAAATQDPSGDERRYGYS
jgi:hypothetical protein